jgi:hypothetical protein
MKPTIKSKRVFLLPFIIYAFALTSCQIHCPEFKKDVLSWIPYQNGDVIELYSQLNDSTIILSVKSIEVTHKTHYTRGTTCGGCDDFITINQNEHGDFNFHVDINLVNKNKDVRQYYYIGDTHFEEYSEIANYLFENKKYDKVRVFEKNNAAGTFQKLIIAKEFGIIGLVDIYGNIWGLKTAAKTNKQGNVVIHNTSC